MAETRADKYQKHGAFRWWNGFTVVSRIVIFPDRTFPGKNDSRMVTFSERLSGKRLSGKRLSGKKTIRESNHPGNDRIPWNVFDDNVGLGLIF